MLDEGRTFDAARLLKKALHVRNEIGDRWGVSESLVGLARVAAVTRQANTAARLCGAADQLRSSVPPIDEDILAQLKSTIRRQLGTQAFNQAYRAGMVAPLVDIVTEALAIGADPTSRNGRRLTRMQSEVLSHLASGLTNREIGQALCRSSRTIDKHVAAILRATGATSRTGAVALAIQQGLLDLPARDEPALSVHSIAAG
jgi:DNA-binding NarL/FixJ family response regulator